MDEPLQAYLVSILALLILWLLQRFINACRRANRVDWGRGWMNLLDGLNRLFCYGYHRLNIVRLRIPKKGPVILAANHVSGLDPLLILASARRSIRFLIAKEEYHRYGLKWLFRAIKCIPVDRETRPEHALRVAIRVLKAGHVVAIFPHGRIVLDSDPVRKIKPGVASLAKITGAEILPIRISGVKGSGHVVRGVLKRSNAKIESFPAISAEGRDRDELLHELQQILDGVNSPEEPTSNGEGPHS